MDQNINLVEGAMLQLAIKKPGRYRADASVSVPRGAVGVRR